MVSPHREGRVKKDNTTAKPDSRAPVFSPIEGSPELEKVIELLRSRGESIAKTTVDEIKNRLPGYRIVPDEEIFNQCIENVNRSATSLRTGTAPSSGEIAEASIAGTRAQQGVPVEDVLQAYRISLGQIKNCFLEVTRGVLPTHQIVEGVRILWESTDAVEFELSRHHQNQRQWAENQDKQLWSHLFAGLLSGRLTNMEFEKTIGHFDLDNDLIYIPLRFQAKGDVRHEEFRRQVKKQSQGFKQQPVFAMVDGDLACLLRDPPDNVANFSDCTAGIGEGSTLDRISQGWANASRALRTAVTFGSTGFHTVDSLGLRSLVVSEERIGNVLFARYCRPFLQQEEFGLPMLKSVWTWLTYSRNFARSADELCVHPNTLRYRLRKFEEVTGADFDNLRTLAEIWWALERWRMQISREESNPSL